MEMEMDMEKREDVHQQHETSDLQHGIRPDENLPAESKTHDPDRDSPARVGDAARSGRDVPGDAKTEEVEEADGERDGDGGAEDAWVGDRLVPSAREVEERRARGDGWEEERERCEKEDRERAEEALPSDRDERCDRVRRHDFLLDDELCRCAAIATGPAGNVCTRERVASSHEKKRDDNTGGG